MIAHHCTSHEISSAVLMHSQHNSDPNTAPYIDGRLALGCLIYNNAHRLPGLAKKTLNKTSTIEVLASLLQYETLVFYVGTRIYLHVFV